MGKAEKIAIKPKKIKISAAAVATLLIVAFAIWLSLLPSHHEKMGFSAISTDKFTITATDLSYYFNSNYRYLLTYYPENYESAGLDPSSSLKSQSYSDQKSWFDYFMDNTKSTLSEIVTMASKAAEMGKTVNDNTILEKVEEDIRLLKQDAKTANLSFKDYIASCYGNTVTEETVRKCLGISYLASEYKDEYLASLSYTDQQIESYVEENKDCFYTADYLSYTISIQVPSDDDENAGELKQKRKEEIKLVAELLASAKSEEDFLNKVRNHLEKTETNNSPENIEKILKRCKTINKYYYDYDDIGRFIFDSERKPGDSYIYEENYSYTVYYILSPISLDTEKTRDMRQILITENTHGADAKSYAEDMLATYLKNPTENNFISLAKEYSEDTTTNKYGGLCSTISKGQLSEKIDNWLFSDKIAPENTAVIQTPNGYHIVYYVGDSKENWKVYAEEMLTEEEFEEDYDLLKKQYGLTLNHTVCEYVDAITIK